MRHFSTASWDRRFACEKLTTLDDPRKFRNCRLISPFDDEGVPSRRTVIENGVLQSWLLDRYTARKLGMKTTGNASRGITGNAGVVEWLYFTCGYCKVIEARLYVTELIGFA